MPLFNSEINLILTWTKSCVLTSKATRNANLDVNPAIAALNNPANVTFKITDTKLYETVLTLSTKDDKKF